MPALEQAIKDCDVEAVKTFFCDTDAKNTLNSFTEDDESYLISAIQTGNSEIVELLLHANADANFRNKSGETPLSVACRENASSDVIPRLLVAHNANVNDCCDGDGSSLPLALACESKNKQVVEFLLASHASVSPSSAERDEVLSSAVKSGDLSIVELILKQYPSTVTSIDTRVIEAAYDVRERTGSLQMLDFFLNGAGNVFQLEDKSDLDMLVLCTSQNQDAEALRYVLGFGPELASSPFHIPFLYGVVCMGFTEGVRILIEHGADVNDLVCVTETQSLLGCAARNKDIETAKVLLDAKADPNVVLESMPLGIAVKNNQWPMVQLLLQHGADPDLCNKHGESAKSLVQADRTDAQIVSALFGN